MDGRSSVSMTMWSVQWLWVWLDIHVGRSEVCSVLGSYRRVTADREQDVLWVHAFSLLVHKSELAVVRVWSEVALAALCGSVVTHRIWDQLERPRARAAARLESCRLGHLLWPTPWQQRPSGDATAKWRLDAGASVNTARSAPRDSQTKKKGAHPAAASIAASAGSWDCPCCCSALWSMAGAMSLPGSSLLCCSSPILQWRPADMISGGTALRNIEGRQKLRVSSAKSKKTALGDNDAAVHQTSEATGKWVS